MGLNPQIRVLLALTETSRRPVQIRTVQLHQDMCGLMADFTAHRAKVVMAVVEGAITAATVAKAAVAVEVEAAGMATMEVAATTVVVAARMVTGAVTVTETEKPNLLMFWPKSEHSRHLETRS